MFTVQLLYCTPHGLPVLGVGRSCFEFVEVDKSIGLLVAVTNGLAVLLDCCPVKILETSRF